ncbi:MAG: hypothetical protein LBT04_02790 [Prevotellaceae bacterium]|jgi:tellurite resistance protein TehA-like permease|nr:hypothetical protein [Prevotellaceae bacterium]
MDKLIKKLKLFFLSICAVAILTTVTSYFSFKNDIIITNQNAVIAIKSAILLFMLIIIPLALKWFSKRVKKIAEIEDENLQLSSYQSASIMRIALISASLLVSTLGYFFLDATDLLYAAGIAVIAMLFCFPTKTRVENDLVPLLKETLSE